MPNIPSTDDRAVWGSDLIAEAIAEQQIPYVCLVPGASFRGLHDSLVNHLGDGGPRLLVCLHEEHSISIAHGWAQVTNEPLAAICHTNVGLMHATMPVFNAWCDRMPMLVLGATGPFDAERRRPWIDWIHTAVDQAALVRPYTKWDDQPGSALAAVDSIRRGLMLTTTSPRAPVFITLDSAIQEDPLPVRPALDGPELYRAPAAPAPAAAEVARAIRLIEGARHPAMLVGRVTRDRTAWDERLRLAERFGLGVYAIYNSGGGFPRSHPLYRGCAQLMLDERMRAELAAADLVLSLDWTDLGGTVGQVWPRGSALPQIIACSDDFHLHRGWSMDYQRLSPASLRIAAPPETFVSAMLAAAGGGAVRPSAPARPAASDWQPGASGPIGVRDLAAMFNDLTREQEVTLVSRTLGWPHAWVRVEHPLDFLGAKGGEGLGAGPGMLVGAALAIRDRHPGRLAVSVLGDGDFLMGASALWTAAAERIPLLAIVANNRCYHNDVVHQERVAVRRGRSVDNKWIGMRIDEPSPDIAMHARSLGCEAAGPVTDLADLREALAVAIARARAGASYVLDVHVMTE